MKSIQDIEPILANLVRELETTVPYAAAWAQDTLGEELLVDSREARAKALKRQQGVVVTVFTGRSFLEYALNGVATSEFCDRLTAGAEALVSAALTEGVVDLGLSVDPGTPLIQDFAATAKIPPEQISLSKVVLCEGDHTARMHGGHCYLGGFEHAHFGTEDRERLIRDAGRILGAPRLTPGRYDCIFSPEFAGIFAHEAFGHGTESDLFLQRRSRGQEYLDKQVASPLVDLYDSPALLGQAASFYFDHEGKLAEETKIIEQGILKRPITDLHSSLHLGLKRSANGRRESYARKIYARMTNTYFGPGRSSFEEMVENIEFGYFLDHPSNGMEDPKGWGIQLEGLYAEEIRQGRLTGKIFSPVIVTGYVPELLQAITMVGPQVEISGLGLCGKGHKEWVKVSDGGPYLRLQARLG